MSHGEFIHQVQEHWALLRKLAMGDRVPFAHAGAHLTVGGVEGQRE